MGPHMGVLMITHHVRLLEFNPPDFTHVILAGRVVESAPGGDLAHDIRLACHGLDARDNEFVIGLTGAHLQPLSHVVQTMRRTRQTAEFIQSMGPFFVGHAVR